jgi:hypothetical protein
MPVLVKPQVSASRMVRVLVDRKQLFGLPVCVLPEGLRWEVVGWTSRLSSKAWKRMG